MKKKIIVFAALRYALCALLVPPSRSRQGKSPA